MSLCERVVIKKVIPQIIHAKKIFNSIIPWVLRMLHIENNTPSMGLVQMRKSVCKQITCIAITMSIFEGCPDVAYLSLYTIWELSFPI